MKKRSKYKLCSALFKACIAILLILIFILNASPSLALSHQERRFTDSTPDLRTSPNQLNKSNCSASNSQLWTCVITLYGENIGNTIAWTASTPTSRISINPAKGYLAKVASIVQVTISNIPCTNTSILFSGQQLGGGGVIPTTLLWNCTPKPTPTPYPVRSTPAPQSSPTPSVTTPSSTPITTTTPRSTPTISLSPTSVVSVLSQSKPPENGNGTSLRDLLIDAILIVVLLGTLGAFIVIALLIKRRFFKL